MNIIELFEQIGRHPGYDPIKNPQQFTVAELMPIEIRWKCGRKNYVIQNSFGIGGVVVSDRSGIAAVEAPYDVEKNRALILNCDGSIRTEVDRITKFGKALFYEAIYIEGRLNFLAAIGAHDWRLEVSEKDGSLKHASGM